MFYFSLSKVTSFKVMYHKFSYSQNFIHSPFFIQNFHFIWIEFALDETTNTYPIFNQISYPRQEQNVSPNFVSNCETFMVLHKYCLRGEM